MIRLIVIPIVLIWLVWASISDGGFVEIKQVNPKYAHPDRSVAYLVTQHNNTPDNGFWPKWHVEKCSMYMPSWEKAETCVKARISCERGSTYREINDYVYSDPYTKCLNNRKPSMGPFEWLRLSRGLYRVGIMLGVIWVGAGFDMENTNSWAENNKGIANWLKNWVERTM